MAQLGTEKHPAVVRVQSLQAAEQVMSVCEQHGWKVVVGIEPQEPEDLSDLEKLLDPTDHVGIPARSQLSTTSRVGRNDPCSCGSGLKLKRCCGSTA